MATVLSAKQVAVSGGETEFANSYAAYDALSDAEKQRYGRFGSCTRWRRRNAESPRTRRPRSWRSGGPGGPTTHPLVWTHRSGRRSLVLGASADYVVGMDRAEGVALLAELLDRATVPDKVYSHTWAVADTVIWDNRGVLHRAAAYDPSSPREMLRTTVLGDEPIQ